MRVMMIRLENWEDFLLMFVAVASFLLALFHTQPWNCLYYMGFELAIGALWCSEPVEVNKNARK
jgi:hypothetical protein